MYSTCLFCHTDLGANEAVEHFPVGRRLAFEAIRVAAQILPRLNQSGASRRTLEQAVTLVTDTQDPNVLFRQAARLAKRSWNDFGEEALLHAAPTEMRLALEMLSHEESERRALEGELSVLEDAWREAEEIAQISDDMFLPTEVSQKLAEIKSRAGPESR